MNCFVRNSKISELRHDSRQTVASRTMDDRALALALAPGACAVMSARAMLSTNCVRKVFSTSHFSSPLLTSGASHKQTRWRLLLFLFGAASRYAGSEHKFFALMQLSRRVLIISLKFWSRSSWVWVRNDMSKRYRNNVDVPKMSILAPQFWRKMDTSSGAETDILATSTSFRHLFD